MAEPRFTPGPWFIGPDYVDDEGHREIAIQAANGLGGVCTPASVVLQFPKQEGMQEANAHLIAAAPELYSALAALRHECIEAGFVTATDYGWPAAMKGALDALTKAEGGS